MLAVIAFLLSLCISVALYIVYRQLDDKINKEQDSALTQFFAKKIKSKYKPDDTDDTLGIWQKYRNRSFVLCFLLSVPLTWIFSVNAVVLLFKYIGSILGERILFWPPVQYDDILVVLISFGGAIYLAYFQYRIQRELQEKSEIEKKGLEYKRDTEKHELEQKEEIEREIQEKKYRTEIISERLRSLRLLECKTAYAVNFNLVVVQKHQCHCHNTNFHIVIGNIDGPPYFYQAYFSGSRTLRCETKTSNGMDIQVNVNEFAPNYLEFDLQNCEEVKAFFRYPVRPVYNNSNQHSVPPALSFCAEIQGKDASADIDISYDLKFSIHPDDKYGYTENGDFALVISNVLIQKH